MRPCRDRVSGVTDTPFARRPAAALHRRYLDAFIARLKRIGWGSLPLAIALPAAFGLGSILFLTLPAEPPRIAVLLTLPALAMIAAALILARYRRVVPIVLLVLAMVALGYARAEWRTHAVQHTILSDSDRARTVTGWIETVQRSGSRERLILRVSGIDGLDTPPPRIRVTASRGEFVPGDPIRIRAVLGPPPRPAAPGSYDAGFASWYAGIGGSGYAISRPEAAEFAGHERARDFARWRWTVAERIRSQMPARSGGVAAALLTGDRSGIDPEVAEALRAAGLGHILAISGLHMALMAGGVFFAATWIIARIEPVARGIDPRRPAAIAAILAAAGYLMLSGGAIPTQRAFVMTVVVLLGVLAGRRAASMHTVGLAALAVLVFQPESIVTPGFQMSFAAALALIAAFSLARKPSQVPRGPFTRFAGFWGGLAGSSFVAGMATAGFAGFHFHRLAAYGFGANLAAMPIFSLIVMPAGAFALLLLPFGLEAPALWVMGVGLDWVIGVSMMVSHWPGALTPAPAAPGYALAIYAAGFIALVAGRGGVRVIGAAIILVSAAAWLSTSRPDALITEGGVMIARFDDAEDWSVSNARRSRFAARVFLERVGEIGADQPGSGVTCDAAGCTGQLSGYRVAFPATPESLADDCRMADIVVMNFTLRTADRMDCAATVIDARDLRRSGALSIWINSDGRLRTRSVEQVRGDRLWTGQGGRDS